ncbi:hypothetical protein [Nocardia sp. CC227C]|uniref:hypothetical protein n=1 Tax=Nocardia sp. CC227C TaxID=3044562 RepID=UPI00278C8693|nr:hypothetical protein [Nocardia sp. CC227C]
MPNTPGWVRRNRFAAWSGYFCALVAFATLAMALTAAGTGHSQWAIVAGGICAATLLFALMLMTTTVHRDHLDHHDVPSLLNDSYATSPGWARQRDTAHEPHRLG